MDLKQMNKIINQKIDASGINKKNEPEKRKITLDILKFISEHKNHEDYFVSNKKFFCKSDKDTDNELWLLEPINIYCKDVEILATELCDYLFAKKYKYVRGRSDINQNIILLEIDFEVIANIFSLPKEFNLRNLREISNKISNVNIITKPYLTLAEIYFGYITPQINSDKWEENMKIENTILNYFDLPKKQIVKPTKQFKTLDEYHHRFLNKLEEVKETYLLTGEYTIQSMLTTPVNMEKYPIYLYTNNPEYFLDICKDLYPNEDISVTKKDSFLYFWDTLIEINVNGQNIVNLIKTEHKLTGIKMNFLYHTNFHGTLMFIYNQIIQDNLRERYYLDLLHYLVESKHEYLARNNVNEFDNHRFSIFNNQLFGEDMLPILNHRKREWNRENRFSYRPDKKENKETEQETTEAVE